MYIFFPAHLQCYELSFFRALSYEEKAQKVQAYGMIEQNSAPLAFEKAHIRRKRRNARLTPPVCPIRTVSTVAGGTCRERPPLAGGGGRRARHPAASFLVFWARFDCRVANGKSCADLSARQRVVSIRYASRRLYVSGQTCALKSRTFGAAPNVRTSKWVPDHAQAGEADRGGARSLCGSAEQGRGGHPARHRGFGIPADASIAAEVAEAARVPLPPELKARLEL